MVILKWLRRSHLRFKRWVCPPLSYHPYLHTNLNTPLLFSTSACSMSHRYVWSVFSTVVGMSDKGTRITTVCSQVIANHIALQHQLADQKKCYVSWTHTKETPEQALVCLHDEILANKATRVVQPIYFVREHILCNNMPVTQCTMCRVGIPDCLTLK